MATLEKIRGQAGLLVIVVGVALFAFIIGDFLNSGSSYMRASQDEVVNVDGVSVNYRKYQDRIDEMTNVYKLQSNATSLPEEYNMQIRQSVYSSLVRELVMDKALSDIGLQVTSEELFDLVQGENVAPIVRQIPLFTDPQTGVYSKARALNILKMIENLDGVPAQQRAEVENVRNYWLYWERAIKNQRAEEKYTSLLTKAIVANPLDARNAYESGLENSDIAYVMQSYATVPDSAVKVSDSEVKRLYEQRKSQYRQKETRILDYIAVNIRPSEEDYAKASESIERVKEELILSEDVSDIVNENSDYSYNDFYVSEKVLDADMVFFVNSASIADVEGPIFRDDSYRLLKLVDKTVGPDSLKVSHIILTDQSVGGDSESFADSLLNVIKDGGDWSAIALAHSADQSNASNGGELGWLTEQEAYRMFGKEFKEAIFSAPYNAPTLLTVSYGTHIFKVTDHTSNIPKYKVAYIHMTVSPSSKTYGNLYNDLNQFIAKNSSADKISASASESGYSLTAGVRVTKDDRTLGAVTDSRPVIRWAFEEKKRDEVSQIFECKEHFVVAIRRGTLPEGYQPLNQVSSMLRAELLSRKKGERIAGDLKSRNLQTLESYASAMNAYPDTVSYINFGTSRITKIGIEPALNASIVYTPVNQLSEPVIGNNGVYVFRVLDRKTESREYNEPSEIRTLESSNLYRVGYSAIQSLSERAKIVDNRIRFD